MSHNDQRFQQPGFVGEFRFGGKHGGGDGGHGGSPVRRGPGYQSPSRRFA